MNVIENKATRPKKVFVSAELYPGSKYTDSKKRFALVQLR